MATARERRLTEQKSGETMNNSESDVSSEDELLMAFDCISINSKTTIQRLITNNCLRRKCNFFVKNKGHI